MNNFEIELFCIMTFCEEINAKRNNKKATGLSYKLCIGGLIHILRFLSAYSLDDILYLDVFYVLIIFTNFYTCEAGKLDIKMN